jgi:LysM repeat protein
VTEERLRIWAARLAAPVAFFVAAGVLIALVQGGLSSSDTGTEATPSTTISTTTETTPPTTTGRNGSTGRRRFYRVRSGDTLESIALRFDTTASALSELNPGIDPLALTPGQKVRVRQ